METIDYKNKTLKDDLSVEIKKGSKISIAAACFSIYAFAELKTIKKYTEVDEEALSSMSYTILKEDKEFKRKYIHNPVKNR